MKKIVNLFIAFITIIFGTTIKAQTASPKLENSLLWEVSGNGLSKPSYLYGTIHMICSSDYFLTDKTKKALETSEKLVLEVNFSDPKEMSEMQQLAMGKEPLSKKLNPEQLSKLNEILKKTTGMTVQQVDSFSLLTVMSLISMKSFGCTDLKFYEMEFIGQAKNRNVEIGGLETVKEQFGILENAYSNEEMIAMLEESTPEESAKLVSTYKQENIDLLYDFTTDKKFTSEKTKKIILDERNLNWVKNMPELMKKQSVFFAVGSGHLAGEIGVINLLRKAGYNVKPILN
ncbi:polysaccharide biosynthesis protein GumN [Flavobacterium sp. Root901]|uniref:TraB/GumN family protein n=1 Tax=Flavobacterium sp. Root901 TaxID=1736605 RepID=UPI00070FB598|nr:TraB/GumN family protein [Flavobacterium sp. Root901]KRD11559.1 polysaccharide biosynthesis protein GumN [Flavobacterium sp. Root901]